MFSLKWFEFIKSGKTLFNYTEGAHDRFWVKVSAIGK